MTQYVTGVRELDQKLEMLKKSTRNAIVRPAVAKAAREGAKIVKGKVPSRYKDVRAAIGSRMVKAKQTGGEVVAKVGAGVGKRSRSVNKQMGSLTKSYSRNRPGVGISANNIHWWFFGTDERWQGKKFKRRRGAGGSVRVGEVLTGNTVRSTGKMKPQEQPVMAILAPHQSRLKRIITDEVRQRLVKLAFRGK